MKNRYLAKLASGAVITTLVLAGGSALAFAQTTGGTGGANAGPTVGWNTPPTNQQPGGGPGYPTQGPTPGVPNTGATPGVPNTGAGGDAAANLTLLAISALVLIGGGAYLARQRFMR